MLDGFADDSICELSTRPQPGPGSGLCLLFFLRMQLVRAKCGCKQHVKQLCLTIASAAAPASEHGKAWLEMGP
jgi:hypothetical protein